jgi:futalosine hydrolase
MKILIVAATGFEIRPLTGKLTFIDQEDETLSHYRFRETPVDIIITGVGMVSTAYHMGRQLSRATYDLVLNAGICGSFLPDIPIGKVVEVVEENFSELGAEDKTQFLTLFELGLMDPDEAPYSGGRLVNRTVSASRIIYALPKARGSTANTIHGTPETIREIKTRFQPDVESMEGAAFLFACLKSGLPCNQIRCISNFVEEREKSKWNVELALKNLNKVMLDILNEIEK